MTINMGKGGGVVRTILAFIVSPLVVSLFVLVVITIRRVLVFEADVIEMPYLKHAFIMVWGMTLIYTFILIVPFYTILRIRKMYSLKSILKGGAISGLIVGLMIVILLPTVTFLPIGFLAGLLGGALFHAIHGDVTSMVPAEEP